MINLFYGTIYGSNVVGRPHVGIVASIMRRTRAAYHYAVRFIKNNKLDIIKERFANDMLENRGRDFWFEAKNFFDSYVLNRYDSILTSSNLQLGFIAGYLTSMTFLCAQ